MCETERVGGEVWRTGVERGTEAEQQGERDTEAGRQAGRERKTERRCSLMLHECRVIEEVLIKQFE